MNKQTANRRREIARLRKLLETGRFTQSELMSLRGKIGGLCGAEHPGRRKGGLASAKKRWGFTPGKRK